MYHVEAGWGDPGVVHAEGGEGDLWVGCSTGLCRPTACVVLPREYNALFPQKLRHVQGEAVPKGFVLQNMNP
jgi:hypothetical protein